MDVNTCLATTDVFRTLAVYSHIIPALAVVILGFFANLRAQNRAKVAYFFAFTVLFAVWLLGDVIVWTANSYNVVAAFWAPLDLTEIVFFLLLFGFVCTDLFDRTPRFLLPLLGVAAALPLGITLLGESVFELYQPACEMLENPFLSEYKRVLEALILGATLVLSVIHIVRTKVTAERIRVGLIAFSVVLFMGIFGETEYIASLSNVYEINLYALFTLPLFVLLLTIAITSYGTFRLGDTAVKALFYVFLVLAGTQFFFVEGVQSFLLALMSFAVVVTLGFMLFRSNEREIAARREVERLSEEKSEFMTFASHEIRNPITAMRGLASELSDGTFGELPKDARVASEKILIAGNEVLHLISEFLNKSKSELGQISYALSEFDAARTVSDLTDTFRANAAMKGLSLEKHISRGESRIRADEAKLKEVVGNLIDNAVKYTKEGRVTVSVATQKDKTRITVSDTGPGIPPETMPKLFQKFSRADAAKANLLGTGVGLYLAKVFIEGMGGRIWAESDGAGKGSRFIVEFSKTT